MKKASADYKLDEFVGSLAPPSTHSFESLPRVSVVMPSYNQGRFIERSILSVLNQGYPNLEFIIVDGGSQDETLEILKKYESRLAWWVSERDNGQSDALNKGFSRASGDIFAWLNSDDLLMPGAIARAIEAFSSAPTASVVFGDWWTVDIFDKQLEHFYAFDFDVSHFIFEGFTHNAQAMFWTADAHRRFGNFDVELYNTMDYDFIVRMGLNEHPAAFVRVPYPLACFRIHPDQKTQGFDSRVRGEHEKIAAKIGRPYKFSRIGRLIRLIYRSRRAFWYAKRAGIGYSTRKALGSLRGAKAWLGKMA